MALRVELVDADGGTTGVLREAPTRPAAQRNPIPPAAIRTSNPSIFNGPPPGHQGVHAGGQGDRGREEFEEYKGYKGDEESDAELAQVMIHVPVTPDEPIALAHVAEHGMHSKGTAFGEGFDEREQIRAIVLPV